MNKASFFKVRLYFTAVVTIAIWALLSYQHYHGGVPNHHILADENLPRISNWWGALVLPVLTWVLLHRIGKRVYKAGAVDNPDAPQPLQHVVYGFAVAFLFGNLLSIFFTLGFEEVPGYMLLGVLALAFFVPIYRAQCLLGFVIGMTLAFGAVLPTGFGLILSLITAVLYLFVRPSILFVVARLTGKKFQS